MTASTGRNRHAHSWQKAAVITAAAALSAVAGYAGLSSSSAATASVAAEAEAGAVAGHASAVTDAAASGGQAVRFGAGSQATGGYTVDRNVVRDPSGKPFFAHGVARPTLEWSCSGLSVNNNGNGIPASDFTTMHDAWSANTVRLALNQDFWLQGAAAYCGNYRSNVAAAIHAARSAGLVVIADLHWSDAGNLGNGSPAQQCMADDNSVTFWQQFADSYKGDSGVWFELYNEPHDIDWNTWKNGGTACGFQTPGMQKLYQTVRGTGAANIVVATGKDYGSHLDGVPLLSGSNITYAIHPYANDISDGDPNAWSNDDWNNRFGYLAAKAPVIATEFGRTSCNTTTTYDQGILDFFRTHGVGYTGWAWFVGGCTFPSLIRDASGACTEYGCAVQSDLKAFAAGSRTMVVPAYTGP